MPVLLPAIASPRLLRSTIAATAVALALACAAANVTDGESGAASDPQADAIPGAPVQPAGSDQPVADAPLDTNGQPKPTASGLRTLGRANQQNVLSWSGAAIEVAFSGTQMSASLQPLSGNNVVGVTVDGAFDSNRPVSATAPIVIGPLPPGEHVVRLTKLNEARLGVLRWLSVAFDGNASTPVVPARRLEFIGDSITSAYGIDGNGPACSNTSATENALKAFPALVGAALQADVSVISYSGRGLWRNDISDANGQLELLPKLWSRTTANGADGSWLQAAVPASRRPAAVVVMLGTNDYEYTAEDANGTPQPKRAALDGNAFVAAGVSFVQQIQSAYPGVKVLLCGSPLLQDTYPSASDQQHTSLKNNLESVAAQTSAATLDVASMVDPNHPQTSGCGGHPNRQGHQTLANAIQGRLQALLGW